MEKFLQWNSISKGLLITCAIGMMMWKMMKIREFALSFFLPKIAIAFGNRFKRGATGSEKGNPPKGFSLERINVYTYENRRFLGV